MSYFFPLSVNGTSASIRTSTYGYYYAITSFYSETSNAKTGLYMTHHTKVISTTAVYSIKFCFKYPWINFSEQSIFLL